MIYLGRQWLVRAGNDCTIAGPHVLQYIFVFRIDCDEKVKQLYLKDLFSSKWWESETTLLQNFIEKCIRNFRNKILHSKLWMYWLVHVCIADKLDGIKNKHPSHSHSSMEELLQVADEYFARQIQEPGKKRVSQGYSNVLSFVSVFVFNYFYSQSYLYWVPK